MKSKHLHRKGRRLEVRPFAAKDFTAWRQLHSALPAPKNKWDMKTKPEADLTRANFKLVLRRQKEMRAKDSYYDLGVFLKDGRLIGGVSAMEVTRGISHSAFLGYQIYNPYWAGGRNSTRVRATIILLKACSA